MKIRILATLLLAYLGNGCKQNSNNQTVLKPNDDKSILLAHELKSVFNCSFNSIYNNGRSVEVKTIINPQGQAIQLDRLFKPGRSLLVLNISDSYCVDCMHECKKMIDTVKRSYKKIDCIILGSFSSSSAKQFLIKDLKTEVYEGVFNLPANKAYQPFFFIIKKDHTVSDCFFPIAAVQAYNHTYVSSLKKYDE